ncbi:hypothetical protein EDC94DRAFT_612072 [Helicostylum pulchrum]|nr:hypothetical protein EDC94DRAFT_612072 [Helicostylum pulchrum]
MSSILNNLPPWPQLSFVLAKEMLRLEIPQRFLTATEQESFTQALTSFDSWTMFISKDHINVFRVRTMISEQLIPFFSNQENCCCQSPLDLKKLCLQAHQIEQSSPVPTAIKEFVNSDHVPLLDIFHTLEFDMADMMEQRKLDEFKTQEEAQEEESAPTFTILDENDHSSLKYLLKGISENRNKTSLSDRELRNLLLDAKPHRSKWANDDKIGQEDLYEACEKVLTDLKNYTEHSTPFLSKVNKREAPDYLEVIKDPMDLGLVAKKLKHCQYKNKREFANDLYLIYENCLAYNTNPGSEFRKHATAMKRKTDRLLVGVPEISIKERSEHDMEEMEETDDEDHTRERSMTHESLEDLPHHRHHNHYGGKHPQKGTPLKPLTELVDDNDDAPSAPVDFGEIQNKIWTQVTKNTRAKLTTDIEKEYQFEFGNRSAMHRSALDMERFSRLEHLHQQPELTKKLMRCSSTAFVRWVDRHEGSSVHDLFDLTSEDEEGFDGGFFFSSKTRSEKLPPPTDEDDALRTDLFLPEYYLLSGVPEIAGVAEEYLAQDDEDEEAVPSLDVYVATKPPQSGLVHSIDHNIELMQHNRSIYNKCMAVRNNQPISTEIGPTTYQSPAPVDTGTPTPSLTQNTPPMLLNKQASDQMLQRSVSNILQHAGFESSHSTALNVLTDMMSEYLGNIAKTARKYWDMHGKSMTGEDILQHTLSENNVESVGELDRYVTDDIQKYGNRLLDSRRKLENTYRDLVTGPAEGVQDNHEDDEALINGLFNQDLGEDFFGFKELGLDQAFNMRSLTVPPRLLIGKDKPLIIPTKSEPKTKYPHPPSFIPATPHAFIGLLKPWFQSRPPTTLEDEYIPKKSTRPRQPPVNIRSAYLQHQQAKRRVLKDGSNTQANEEAKRKRKRALEESKAQKKKQKLELKQLKLAEKEQKKKIREEEKLAKKKV